MKTKTITTFLLMAFFQTLPFSQTKLQGYITNEESGVPVLGGGVAIYKNGNLIAEAKTDVTGFYSISEIDGGEYDVSFYYLGYDDYKIKQVCLNASEINNLDGSILFDNSIKCYNDRKWIEPLINRDQTSQGFNFFSKEIKRLAF